MKRLITLIFFAFISCITSNAQIKDFFGIPIGDCAETTNAIFERYKTKDTYFKPYEGPHGIQGYIIFNADMPEIGSVSISVSSKNQVSDASELGKCIRISVTTQLKLIDDVYKVASLLENHYHVELASDIKPIDSYRFWYPESKYISYADISLYYSFGMWVHFNVKTE